MTAGAKRLGRSISRAFKTAFVMSAVYAFFNGFKALLSSAGSQNKEFSKSLNAVKANLSAAFIPILNAVMPALNSLMSGLAAVTKAIASFIAGLFGSTYAKSVAATKKLQGMQKQAEKTKGSLASFDELNVLDKQDGTGAEGVDYGALDTAEDGQAASLAEKVKAWAEGSKGVKKLEDAFGRLKQSINESWDATKPFREFLKPLFSNLADSLPLLGASIMDEMAGNVKIGAGKLTGNFDLIWEGLKLKALAAGEFIEACVVSIFGQDTVNKIKGFFSDVGAVTVEWWDSDVAPWFTAERWKELFSSIPIALSQKWTEAEDWWNSTGVSAWWNQHVIPWFTKKKWMDVYDGIRTALADKWGQVTSWWNNSISSFFGTKVEPWFTIEKWLEIMSGVKNGIVVTFKNAINTAIGLFNRFIGWLNEKLHFEWDAIEIMGKEIVPAGSVQLFRVPEIPALAQGGIIRQPTLAMMGEYSGATSNPEIAAPESKLRDIFRGEMEQLVDAVNALIDYLASNSKATGDIVLQVDGKTFARLTGPYFDAERRLRGVSLVKGGVF